jgi:hypothetical protein
MPIEVPVILAWIQYAAHGQLKVQRNASLITESYTYDPSLAHLLEPWHGTSRLMRLGVLGRKVVLVIPTRMMFTL